MMVHSQYGKEVEKGFKNPMQNKRQPIKNEKTHTNESQAFKQVLTLERIRSSRAVTHNVNNAKKEVTYKLRKSAK